MKKYTILSLLFLVVACQNKSEPSTQRKQVEPAYPIKQALDSINQDSKKQMEKVFADLDELDRLRGTEIKTGLKKYGDSADKQRKLIESKYITKP